MQRWLIRIGLGSALLVTAISALTAVAVAADAPAKQPAKPVAKAAYKAPHGPDGHPDLNGIWQAMNSANYNIEPHSSSAALQMVPGQFVPVPAPEVVKFGAVGSIPAGLGVVDGNEIPYQPWALAKKKENQAN